ncbi:hypothetical protein [Paenibacillus sp.]|uniref:hypothetical protein n=1 Tax=Paenibacillus sp. TaxID=58172 RepID=UPI002811AD53|nr:hypothetical protein [Paenibacillus sp.]
MSIRRALLSVSVGILVGAVAIGLLPFLAVLSWAELSGLAEMDSSPIFLLFNKLYRKNRAANGVREEGESE